MALSLIPGVPAIIAAVLAVASLALAAAMSFQAVRYLYRRTRFEAKLPGLMKKLAPQFAFHWHAPRGTAYQAAMWLPYLDRLGVLAGMPGPILLDGPAGSGRRHLARALHSLDREDAAELPMVDMGLVPPGEQTATLQRLQASALGGDWLVANAEHLGPEACSWLIQTTSEGGPARGRALVTLDAGTAGPIPDALRSALAPGRVPVPGLDERLEDLPLLLDAFAREVGRRPDDVSTGARALLARRAWAGHLAELRTAVHQAAVRADKATLLPEHFEASLPDAGVHLSESVELGYHDAVRSFRRDLLSHALEVCGDNRTRAAELLGLQRTYFMRLIRDLGATEDEADA
ncbi:MAG: hypothetical protein CVU56_06145 [Deltaproteobacteria bacterium HGW-Deltaproteobacteria-14]|nr:MAG: hypothetical protein CVU56_06145 [Deltaproteobacteria bacterium HGW-Deltaproteobacteria-14]